MKIHNNVDSQKESDKAFSFNDNQVSITALMKTLSFNSVRKQVVNIPSFVVRLDSQKHIDFSLKSPFGGGRPGRVKRKNMKKGQGGSGGGDEEEED